MIDSPVRPPCMKALTHSTARPILADRCPFTVWNPATAMRAESEALIHAYYDAFNRQDMPAFLALLSDEVVHDINQGGSETGRAAFSVFMDRMNAHYREEITDIVVLSDSSGERLAAEFTVLGSYLKTDDDLPEANGQRYRLRAGAFFEVQEGKIARVSNYYNLPDWVAQVSQG